MYSVIADFESLIIMCAEYCSVYIFKPPSFSPVCLPHSWLSVRRATSDLNSKPNCFYPDFFHVSATGTCSNISFIHHFSKKYCYKSLWFLLNNTLTLGAFTLFSLSTFDFKFVTLIIVQSCVIDSHVFPIGFQFLPYFCKLRRHATHVPVF